MSSPGNKEKVDMMWFLAHGTEEMEGCMDGICAGSLSGNDNELMNLELGIKKK